MNLLKSEEKKKPQFPNCQCLECCCRPLYVCRERKYISQQARVFGYFTGFVYSLFGVFARTASSNRGKQAMKNANLREVNVYVLTPCYVKLRDSTVGTGPRHKMKSTYDHGLREIAGTVLTPSCPSSSPPVPTLLPPPPHPRRRVERSGTGRHASPPAANL